MLPRFFLLFKLNFNSQLHNSDLHLLNRIIKNMFKEEQNLTRNIVYNYVHTIINNVTTSLLSNVYINKSGKSFICILKRTLVPCSLAVNVNKKNVEST